MIEEIVRQLNMLQRQVDGIVKPEVILNNRSALIAPTINDGSFVGYSIGSIWIDTTLDDAYICCDATAGAAVWKKITP